MNAEMNATGLSEEQIKAVDALAKWVVRTLVRKAESGDVEAMRLCLQITGDIPCDSRESLWDEVRDEIYAGAAAGDDPWIDLDEDQTVQ